MKQKLLLAVMALLTMATGKIWAEEVGEGGTTTNGFTAYVVLCNDNSLHFLCSTTPLNVNDKLSTNGPTISKMWSGNAVLDTGTSAPGWKSDNSDVTSVVIDASFENARPKSCYEWFRLNSGCQTIEGIDYLNTSEVTNMCSMFYNYKMLTLLDLSKFDTSNVTDMSFMFSGCSGLTSLDLSKFDTSSVTNMCSMFCDCSGLSTLNLSNFVTSNVTDMSLMFRGCSGLTTLTLSTNFDTSKVTNMSYMFRNCEKLTSLNLSSFNTSKVADMSYMFRNCSGLTTLTLDSFDMSNVSISNNMFGNCNKSSITINGNAFVFVTGNVQKDLWTDFHGLKFVENGVYSGDVVIDSENYKDAPLIISRDFTANKVTFTRSFTAGNPHTIYLPFAINNTTNYGEFYEYGSYNPENGEVTFKKVDETEANKPYLFVPNENNSAEKITVIEGVDGKISATTVATAEEEGFIGIYKKRTFIKDEADAGIYYGWANGKFWRAGNGASVSPCRAYLKLPERQAGRAPASLSVKFDGDGTTGIGTAKSNADGGAEAPMYNLQGQRVGAVYKGLVIKNGRKVIVK